MSLQTIVVSGVILYCGYVLKSVQDKWEEIDNDPHIPDEHKEVLKSAVAIDAINIANSVPGVSIPVHDIYQQLQILIGGQNELYEYYIDNYLDGSPVPPGTADPDVQNLPWQRPLEEDVDDTQDVSSPLVLDIDGDGIELTNVESSGAVYWDADLDGFAETVGWITGGDGLLAIDINQDGYIKDSSELFGDQTGYANGFLALSSYDSNQDGLINQEDSVWSDLLVWIDNGDGVAAETELHTMEDLLITEIDLGYTDTSSTIEGNEIKQESTFTINGATRDIVDVYFAKDDLNSYYGQSYELDIGTFALPQLRGTGEIPHLYVSMSLDNDTQDPESLISLVTDVSETSFSDLFDETANTADAVVDIMYLWAGVEGVSMFSRGPNIDARKLEFLEAMVGQPFVQTGSAEQSYPGPYAAVGLEEAFQIGFNNIYARLLAQSAGGELFTGDFSYNNATDSFDGITGLEATALSNLESEATGLANTAEREVFWQNVVRMIEFSVGTTNLPGADQTALDDAITASDGSLDLAGILADLDYEAPVGTTYNGTSGNDSLTTDTSDNDEQNGLAGDDTLTASTGNDTLDGGADDDTLTGGVGNDYLLGGTGEDEYHYDPEDGYDVILEEGTGAGNNNDKIVFGSGIDSGDLTITRAANNGLLIQIDNGVDDPGEILIEDQYNYAGGGGHVETIEFYDTSTIDLTAQNYVLTGTSGADNLWGARYGGAGDDTIYGGAGNDTIHSNAPNETESTQENWLYGEAGDDTLYGNGGTDHLYGGNDDDYLSGGAGDDELEGGAGDDRLEGGTGDDDYFYVSGHDVILDTSGTDEIILDAAWDSVTPDYFRIDNDLQIVWDDDNTITIEGHYSTGEIPLMTYDDTSTVDLTAVSATVQGTSGNDTLNGTANDDTLYGFDGDDDIDGDAGSYGYGNDTLYGGAGDDNLFGGEDSDYLDGGAGDDILTGGNGNDHFFYVSGHDTLYDSLGSDILEIDGSWEWGDLSFKRHIDDLYNMVIEIDETNTITIDGHFYSNDQIETLRMNDGTGDVDLTAMRYETHGDENNNTLTHIANGGSTNDIMYGWGGNDTLNGNNGDDELYGGDGNDTLNGYYGDDVLEGGAGDDTLNGQSDDDTYIFYAGGGMDTLNDHPGGTDTLIITGGLTINDISFANSGSYDTRIIIESSVDEILHKNLRWGSSLYHVETITFDDGFTADLPSYASWDNGTAGGDTQTGDGTDEVFVGFDGDDTIDAGAGADHAHGGDGDDTIDGEAGADMLYGGADDDTITGGTGDDVMDGGEGTDTVDYSGDGAAVTVNLTTGTATDGNSDSDTLAGFENVIGSAYNDTITGDSSDNDLRGGAGNDDIDGEGGNDTLTGGTGDDSLDGGDGVDRVNYSADAAGVTVNLSTGSATDGNSDTDTLTDIENVTGSGYNDTITGDDNTNDLIGLAGNDSLTGGAGNDTLNGGTGDDTLNGGDGSGDWVTYASDAAGVTVNLGTGSATDGNSDTDTLSNIEFVIGSNYNDTITGDANVNSLAGGAGNDTLNGAAGADHLHGGAGNDTLNGGDDDDTLFGAAGTDTLNGDAGNDVLYGGTDVDALNGGADNDTLYGNDGGDTLHGDAGDDVLYGQDGLDTLYGDGGADTFIFLYDYAFNDVDAVKDFDISTDNDVLDLSDILANTDYEDGVDAITDWIEITTNGSDSDVKVDITGTGTFGGGTQIATLEGITGLTDEAALVSSGNLVVV